MIDEEYDNDEDGDEIMGDDGKSGGFGERKLEAKMYSEAVQSLEAGEEMDLG